MSDEGCSRCRRPWLELRATEQQPATSVPRHIVSLPRRRAAIPVCVLSLLIAMFTGAGLAQDGPQQTNASSVEALGQAVRDLTDQVRALRATMAEMRADSEAARAETRELRHQIEQLRAESVHDAVIKTPTEQPEGSDASTTQNASLRETFTPAQGDSQSIPEPAYQGEAQEPGRSARAASLEEEYQLLSGKVDDQYQTKVESASKYRMRISGIVLMNLFSNQGTVDNIDLPTLAYPQPAGDSAGSFGATLRQSEIGFEVFGPRLAGARTRADLQLDLAGGFPSEPNGVNSGLMRLRTATMRLDWDNTSLVAGQDTLFFSPNSPTSFATLAQPALSYAGNLWSWVPQVRVEHKVPLGDSSSLILQGGILDPLTGEYPASTPYRSAGPGESARQPAYGTRVAWTRDVFGQPLRLGVGAFYSRQDYGFSRNVDAWAAMSDLEIPLGPKFSLSGKFYRGRALGGLYGAFGQSVLFSDDNTGNAYTQLIGLNTVGGWTQLKYRLTSKLEFNWAFGMDNPYAKDLDYFPYAYSYGDATLSRNRAGFGNVIYRPRSDLLFSAEYRQIETNSIATGLSGAGHLNLMMGVLF